MIKRLSEKGFVDSFKNVPRVAVNLIINNHKGKVLLTKRASPPSINYWHIPGTYILKGELIEQSLKRLAKTELGINLDISKAKLLGVFEDLEKDPRGHTVDVIYGYELDNLPILTNKTETKELIFFARFPKNIGFNHKDYLIKLGYKLRS